MHLPYAPSSQLHIHPAWIVAPLALALVCLLAVGAATVLAPESVPAPLPTTQAFDAASRNATPAADPYALPAPAYPAGREVEESAPTF